MPNIINEGTDVHEIIRLFPQLRQQCSKSKNYIYRCICSTIKTFGSHRERFRKHIMSCPLINEQYFERKSRINRVMSTTNQITERRAPTLQQFQQTKLQWQTQNKILKDRVVSVQIKVNSLDQTTNQYLKDINASKQIASSIIHDIKDQISIIITDGISDVISFAKQTTKTEMRQLIPAIKKKILLLLRQLDYFTLIDSYRQQLAKMHEDLIKQKSSTDKRNLEKYYRGYQVWDKFTTLKNYSKIVEVLNSIKPNRRKQALLYYRTMKKRMVNIPDIPQIVFLKKKLIKKEIKKLTIQDLRDIVKYFIDKNDFVLACDFWVCVCIGLRAPDLLNVYFQQNGIYFDAVSVIQSKNQHRTLKPIPQSLKKLISKYKVEYPLTEARISSMREVASRLKRRFYGYRSACITGLMTCFSRSMLQTHRSSVNTQAFYLNLQNSDLIDTIFYLDCVSKQPDIERSNKILHQDDDGTFRIKGMNNNQILFTLQQLYENEQQQDDQRQDISVLGKKSIDQTQAEQPDMLQYQICHKILRSQQINISGKKY